MRLIARLEERAKERAKGRTGSVRASIAKKIASAVIAATLAFGGVLPSLPGAGAAAGRAEAADAGTGTEAARTDIDAAATAVNANLAVNPGFEDSAGDWSGWTYEGTAGALTIKTDTPSSNNVRSGERSASYWSAGDYQFKLYQTITGLENGEYALKAWSSGDPGNRSLRLFADGFGGEKRSTPIDNSGWGTISSYTVDHIQVTNGQATIGFEVDSVGGKWGFFDDVEFYRMADPGAAPTWAADKSLTVESVASRGAALKWSGATDGTGVTQYRVYLNGQLKATTSSASSRLTGLAPGTAYTVKVEAGDAAGLWSEDGPEAAFETPEAGGSEEFIKGADISTLQAIEDAGGKYYENGQEKDLLAILKDRGVNYIRLRLWNDPVEADGYNDKAHVIEMAKRVKEAGLKLLLDFHYSDFWADPGKQVKPAAWSSLGYDELKKAVYDYTTEVLGELEAEGAYPDMVQVGNEINSGMLLPDGSVSDYDKLAGLLAEGIRGVRDTTPPGQETKVMLHLAEGGNNGVFRGFFDAMTQRNVDFDVIGFSYYPFWHGTLGQLKNNLNDIAARYGKEVVVAETSYGYTLADGDGWANSFGQAEADEAGFPATVEGQKRLVTTVMNTVAHVPDGLGLGVFYWEPAWIPVPKNAKGEYQAGWKSKEGNAWDNQAMFDFKGNALDSLDAFAFEPGDLPDVLPVSVKAPEGVTVPANASVEEASARLPESVDVLFNEGSFRAVPVAWSAIDPEALTRIGTFELTGTVQDIGETVRIAVTVSAYKNVLGNPGFEEDYDFGGWTLTGTPGAAKVKEDSGNAYSGTHAVNYYAASDFAFELAQKATGLVNGRYVLKARVSGGGGERSLRLFASGLGGEPATGDNVANTGWKNWNEPALAFDVTNGEATVGLAADAPGGTWGWIDDFELYREVAVPEWRTDKKLAASSVGARKLKLEWSGVANPEGLAGYKIYADGRKIATVGGAATSYEVTGLAPKTSYAFKVEASYDGAVWTSTGPEVTVKTASSSGGGGSGPTTEEPAGGKGEGAGVGGGVFEVAESDLLAGEGDAAIVRVPAGAGTVRLPAQASALLNGRALDLRADGIEVRIPAALLKRLGEKLGANASEGANGDKAAAGAISWRMEPLGKTGAESLRASLAAGMGASVRTVGGAYEFALSIASADGKKSEALTEFAEPVVIRLAADPTADAVATGIYTAPADAAGGTPLYVGGKLRDGMYETAVVRPGRYVLAEANKTFADVGAGHWASEAIRLLAARQAAKGVGIAGGVGGVSGAGGVDGDKFEPSRAVTRAEFAALLVRILGSQAGADSGASAGTGESAAAAAPGESGASADEAAPGESGANAGEAAPGESGAGADETTPGMSGTSAGEAVPGAGGANASAQAFADVPADAWYAAEVAAAAKMGLANGRDGRTFDPNGAITREEMAAMAVKAAALLGGRELPAAGAAGFADAAAISPWAERYVAAAAEWKLAQGRGQGLFAPQGTVTRAEAAQIAANLLRLADSGQ
ncbi:glycosyl hydrolase 53 family protein [Cohnella xylanilytica]|uniref:Arabinogalactan endo-beta-1,4-galactanase n=1 Tax=Cohnella xylanilytica TaxID=557555 RepID=A0A841TXD4_9BACL|nr:glycosyl hydrolase 53 family protein [Cohnella xylanilytica]MBB6693227.1 glycosyl hydrolase 53 family protein [Cohnella xylanilytica]